MSVEKKTALRLRASKNWTLTFLALTSLAVTYPYGLKVAAPLLGDKAPYAAILAALILYQMIDKPLDHGLDYLEKTAGRGGLTWNVFGWQDSQIKKAIIMVLTVFALAMTGSMSFISSYLISNTVAPPPDRAKLEETRQRNLEAYSGILSEINTDIQSAEKSIPRAKRDGHRLVSSAIASGPDKWQKLYREKNGWFMKQRGQIRAYRNRIAKAQADSAALVEGKSDILASLRSQKTEHISKANSVNESTDKAFFADWQRTETMFNSFWKFIFLLDVSAVIFTLILHYFLVLYFRNGGALPEAKSSFNEALSEWRNSVWDRFVVWLFRRKKQDATADANPTERPTIPAPQYAPVRGTEHDEIPVGRVLRLVEAQSEQIQALSNVVTDLKSRTEQRPKDEKTSEKKPTENRRKTRRKKATKPDGKRQCLECKADISHRTKRAKFCCDAHRKNWNEKHAAILN